VWNITIRSPYGEPQEYTLKSGRNTIGRRLNNDIVISDPSASREHAEIIFESESDTITLVDLKSTNGTYVNRERLTSPQIIKPEDSIRIGEHLISLWPKQVPGQTMPTPDTLRITRDLLLESLDHHAVLLYEVASRLNTVVDLDTALTEVTNLVKVPMGADRCEVVLAEDFDKLADLGFATTIAHQALDQRSAVIIQDVPSNPAMSKSASLLRIRTAMCVPIISGNDVLGLIYVFKTRPQARPFDQRDLQLAVAISHQAALTIQRMQLLQRVQREQLVSQLLRRFLSPQEAEYLLKDYLDTGQLPQLTERTLTILVADVRDSSGLAERLGARNFGEILGQYYQIMTDVIFKHDGVLNKYLGDGLMAIFGMTEEIPDPEMRAVRVSLEMLEELKSLNQRTNQQIEIGIGINTGPAVAGYLGSAEHVELTVLGESVNAAWGLESLARPNRVFIGPETFLAVVDEFNIMRQGPVTLRKSSQPIETYEVLPG
jgi:adenylate cyclase